MKKLTFMQACLLWQVKWNQINTSNNFKKMEYLNPVFVVLFGKEEVCKPFFRAPFYFIKTHNRYSI